MLLRTCITISGVPPHWPLQMLMSVTASRLGAPRTPTALTQRDHTSAEVRGQGSGVLV